MNIRISWPVLGLAVLVAAVAVAGLLALGSPTSSARTARELVTAADGVVQSTVTGSGNVEPATQVTASFQASGVLQSLRVKLGQHVLKGQLLATLDPTAAQLTVEQAQSSLTAAEDQLANAENQAGAAASSSSSSTATTASSSTAMAASSSTATTGARTGRSSGAAAPSGSSGATAAQSGSSSGATAQSADSLAAAVASAQAAVDGAQASLHQAQSALSQTRLFAPASGTVVSVADVSPGDTVSGGGSAASPSASSSSSSSASSSSTGSSGLVEIASARRLAMTVSFSESDIGRIHVGQPATVTLDALSGVTLPAHVTSISSLGSSSNGVVSYDATLTLSSSDRRVKAGMSASASVVTAAASGVNLPSSAVTGTHGSVAHLDVMDAGREVSTAVIVGLVGDSRTQIVSGLHSGQQVVVTETLPSLAAAAAGSSSTLRTSRFGGAGLGGAGFGAGGFGGGLRRSLGAAPGGG